MNINKHLVEQEANFYEYYSIWLFYHAQEEEYVSACL